ncbi:protein of unknown function [Methylorubrum extorquens]|uniref:NADH:flavin oxidoreductase/NADH oxidase N-terminal domain-containing protein n=1 Tax=Methylorubrum extorquens TaxID=408 RepID=A0A2N9AJS4_METEX|nr:protein of unknown function [Methylorubrum extorquens]
METRHRRGSCRRRRDGAADLAYGNCGPACVRMEAARSHGRPSGLVVPGEAGGVAMSETDVAEIVAAFGRAAAQANRLGFDAVEIHGAHGYLIDQFFWAGVNQRQDRYGGVTLPERSRFAVEVVRAVRSAVGGGFCRDPAPFAVEAAGLRGETRTDTRRDGGLAHPIRRGGSRHLPLLAAAVLAARVRRLGPEFRGLGEEADGQANDHRRLGRTLGRVHCRLPRRELASRSARRTHSPSHARRLRPRCCRPGRAVRSALGQQDPRGDGTSI